MSPESTLVFEGDYAVRKRGFAHLLRMEVESICFLKHHLSVAIPVPSIIGYCLDEQTKTIERVEENYIRMKRVSGVRLDVAWPGMTPGARATMCQQLRTFLEQVHQIEPEPGTYQIRSIAGGACYNHRRSEPPSPAASVTSAAEFRRPFLWSACPDVATFQSALPNALRARRAEAAETYRRRFARVQPPRRARFCHGDLSWANIFVDEATGRLHGVTDWETAGFWPEWWDYYMALLGTRGEQSWWRQIVAEVMKEYPEELKIMTEMDSLVNELANEEPG
ncbi:hypothetical protein MY10362_003254 [Beauveria mimosiformis]